MTAEPWARFRLYVAGQLVDEARVALDGDPAEVARVATRHGMVCDLAEQAGRKYLVEVEFIDGEHVRWGTDVDGMVIPIEVGMGQLGEALRRVVGRPRPGWEP